MVRQYKSKVSLNTLNSQRNYSFGFDYLNSTFIHVNLNGVELTQPRDFTVNEHEIILVNPPPSGGSLLIYRVTPSNRIVSWTDNSILKADNLNLSYIQLMHLAEEQMDNVRDETITRALDEAWDLKGSRIKRLGTPTDDMDAVPYGYVRHQKEEVEQLTAEVRQHKNTIEQSQRDVLARQHAVDETAQRTTELAQRVTEQLNANNTEFTNKVTKAKDDIERLGQQTTANITKDMTERLNSANTSLNETIATANAVKEQVKAEAEQIRTGAIDEKTKNDIANALLSKQENLITSKLAESAQTQEAMITRKLNENNTSINNSISTKISEHNADTNAHNLNKYMSMKSIPAGINNWNDFTATGMYEATASMWGWSNAPNSARLYYYGVVQVIKSDTNKITQVFYSYGANNKPCNICYRTFYNAWGAWHYHGDYDATVTDITKHDEGLNITKGDVTTVLKFLTTNKADTNTNLAPTLAVVKELLTNAGGNLNIQIEGNMTSGVYIVVGQGEKAIIIQIGTVLMTHSSGTRPYRVMFPISFKRICFGVFYSHSKEDSSGLVASIQTTASYKDSVEFTETTGTSNYRRKVNYIAIGV